MKKREETAAVYNERYDRLMISILKREEEICLRTKKKNKNLNDWIGIVLIGQFKYVETKGRLFDDRLATIQQWKEEDRQLDKMIEMSPPLSDLKCTKCAGKMEAVSTIFKENNTRILYVYDCTNEACKTRKSIYVDGEVYVPKTKYCPECSDILAYKDEKKENVHIFTDYCPTCNYSTSIELELNAKEEKITREDRLKYCHLTKDEKQMIEDIESTARYVESQERQKKENNNAEKYKLDQIEHLKIADLEKHLKAKIEQKKFEKFQLDKPIIKHYVSIEFSVLDSSSRTEKESKTVLRKIIKNELLRTNWRLMTTDISYRLGFMTGKLRAYENQEKLIKIGKEIIEFDRKNKN